MVHGSVALPRRPLSPAGSANPTAFGGSARATTSASCPIRSVSTERQVRLGREPTAVSSGQLRIGPNAEYGRSRQASSSKPDRPDASGSRRLVMVLPDTRRLGLPPS